MINKILLKIIINWVYSNPKNTVPASVSRPAVASLWRPPISVVLTLETNLFAVCQDGFKRLFRKRFFFLISLLDLWTSKVPYCYCTYFLKINFGSQIYESIYCIYHFLLMRYFILLLKCEFLLKSINI